jgi:glycosyltransferase involved in cell wall biosynthesis
VIRVCYVIPSLGIGGTERQLVYLIGGLVRDHEITVVCTSREGAHVGDARRLGAFVRTLDLWGGWDFRLRGKLERVFRQHRPDVVHTFLSGFDLHANRAAIATGVPVIVSSRRELAEWMKPRHLRRQQKANQLVDAIVANSKAVMEYAVQREKAPQELFRVIYNGIRAEDFATATDVDMLRRRFNIPFHRHVVGIVANFSPVKDHALFIQIAKELLRRRPDLHFLMVGSGPVMKQVEADIARHDMQGCFTQVSSMQEIQDLYRVMDVCVLCSKVEGFPNASMEAMAASKPVVAAAVGGIPELVEDGVTGKLVHTRNPIDFASAIELVLDHPDEANLMASRGSAHVRTHFNLDTMVKAYRHLYSELLVKSMRRSE